MHSLRTSLREFVATASLIGAVLFPLNAQAQVHVEIGDAGDLPGTAQVITGFPVLAGIQGELTDGNKDMFQFHFNGGEFTATVSFLNGGDSQLFLFDSNGFGVLANDDGEFIGSPSEITAASLPAGDYFIAISNFNDDPVSAGGLIFPNDFTGVVGPIGPGGALPIIGWSDNSNGAFEYLISLTNSSGVSDDTPAVPESGSTLISLGFALATIAAIRRRFFR